MQKIIMIHQGIVISRRQIEAGVCILRYPAVMIELPVLYALTAFMAIMISNWFSRKLFKKTAMGNFREEV